MSKHADQQSKSIYFDNEALTALANELSQTYWQIGCTVPVVWNGRLSSTMGRFCYTERKKKRQPLRIELSKKAARQLDKETLIAVLLHELCHYHLFKQGKPFSDHHPVFEAEIKRVGAISTNTIRLPQKGYELYCSQCQALLGKRKRFNSKHYLSACCQTTIMKKETWLK